MLESSLEKPNTKMRILIIEDLEDDALLLQRELSKAFVFESERVYAADTLELALQKDWDAIVSDYQMPSFNALDALGILHKSGKDLPFVIVSGTIGEDVAVEAMKAGAHDYLMKGNFTRLTAVLEREMKEARVRHDKNKATDALISSALEWRNTFDSIGDMVAIIDSDMIIHRANRAMFEAFKGKEVIGEKCCRLFHRTDLPPEECKTCLALGESQPVTFEIIHEGLEKQYYSISVYPFGGVKNEKRQFVHIVRDITKQKQMEEEHIQGEKLQALGQLAGGVAHDFNNNLTAILGCASLIEETMDLEGVGESCIQAIQKAAMRSAELTNQLLAFARKGQCESVPTDLHRVVKDVVALLARSIDKRIKIEMNLNASQSTLLGDLGQISNAVLNIAINARDSMDEVSGAITFESKIADEDTIARLKNEFQLTDETYIALSISDKGKGMDQETLKRIFEPFFTTKPETKGTGLGLSAAYGTVLSHKGAITASSSESGSTFNLYFPLHDLEVDDNIHDDGIINSGTGEVLIIDDEEYISQVASNMLTTLGYTSNVCLGGLEGLEFYGDHWRKIDLVILDLVMPDLSGEETFIELRKINNDAKVLISSGYAKPESIDKFKEMGAVGFLPKPYDMKPFSKAVKMALE